MANSISAGLDQLNNTDLSKLRNKLDALRKDIQDAMSVKTDAPAKADKSEQLTGMTTEELLRALEWAKKRT